MLTSCMEVDLVEQNVRVSLVVSCGYGVGHAVRAVWRRRENAYDDEAILVGREDLVQLR